MTPVTRIGILLGVSALTRVAAAAVPVPTITGPIGGAGLAAPFLASTGFDVAADASNVGR